MQETDDQFTLINMQSEQNTQKQNATDQGSTDIKTRNPLFGDLHSF
jgi:hypothetical protein